MTKTQKVHFTKCEKYLRDHPEERDSIKLHGCPLSERNRPVDSVFKPIFKQPTTD